MLRMLGVAALVVGGGVIAMLVWKDAPGLVYGLVFAGVAALAVWWFGDF